MLDFLGCSKWFEQVYAFIELFAGSANVTRQLRADGGKGVALDITHCRRTMDIEKDSGMALEA